MVMFNIILAPDNDTAGYNSVWRFLQNHISEFELPMPHPDDMTVSPFRDLDAYREWLRGLSVRELLAENTRLKDSEYAGADKAKAVEDALIYCRQALEYNKHLNPILIVLFQTN